ncbi:phage tail tip lysozyme [Roseibium sp. SCP14]|uniref:phage tail tip lysozyme n=1 Tax=Roseibium sp. SCP14 TaxID=3141375 RepID=UPI003335BCBC
MTAQPLRMAMLATLDSSGVKTGANDAKSALASISTEAKKAETSLRAAIDAQLGIGGTNTSARAADIQNYGNALDNLRAKYNPLFAAQQNYEKELADIRRAERLGALSTKEAAAAIERTKNSYESYVARLNSGQAALAAHNQSTLAATNFTRQFGLQAANSNQLAAHEATNLSYQMQDIFVSLTSGQSPFIVMAQQGSQVSQIMGKRGLGEILPALAGGIASLINPTTLLFAGLVAGGYAGKAAFDAMRGEVKELETVLDDHTDLVRRIKDAYQEAEDGAVSYARAGSRALELDRVNQEKAERKALDRELETFLDALGPNEVKLQGLGTANEIYRQTREAIDDLIASARTGDPEFARLQERLAEIALSPEFTEGQRSSLSFVAELTKAGVSAEKALKETASGLDQIGKGFEEVTKKAKEYRKAFDRLRDGDRNLGRRDLAREDYNEAVKVAQDTRERVLAERAFRERLQRISDQESARRIPVPGKKPVNIDLGGEARELLKTQEEQLAKLRLETTLIGSTDAVRRRALATLEAEVEIRNAGIDAQSREADRIRENAAAIADMTSELDRSAEAWETVKSTGERSIDTLVDKLSSGDIEGAITSIAGDISKQLLTLGAANPLKNALYNSGLPTFADTGGVGGFFQSLLGGGPLATGSMQVQAATVLVNGEPLSAFSAFNNIASNDNPAFNLAAGNSNSNVNSRSVAGQVWNFFKGKGLKNFQAAAILGHVKAESAFNPFAVGDGGNAFGLFQHNDRRFNLFDAIGGRKNLGNVQGQLDFAWQELMTTESRAMKALLGSTDLRGATAAFGGFERPAGFSWGNPEAMHNWTGRLAAAEEALSTFGGGLANTTSGLTRLDGGLGSAVSALANGSGSLANTATSFAGQSETLAGSLSNGLKTVFNGLGGEGGGGLGAFFQSLISGIGGMLGFQGGGPTGQGSDTDVKGLVHANEFVFSAPATRRIGVKTLEALHRGSLKGYKEGGFVTSYASPFMAVNTGNSNAAGAAPVSIAVHNYSGAQVDVQEQRDERGGRNIRFVIAEQIADGINTPGGAAQRTLRNNYALRKRRVPR